MSVAELNISKTLGKIITPEWLSYYQDWEETATESEQEGMRIIDFIYESRGQKKYHT